MAAAAVIGLIGLEVAILALAITVLLALQKRTTDSIEVDIKDIKRNSFFLDNLARTTFEATSEIDYLLHTQSANVRRLMTHRPIDDNMLSRIGETLRKDRNRVQKALLTMILYMRNGPNTRSALQQLSETYGTADTLVLLVELKEHGFEPSGELERAIEVLKHRLNNNP